MTTSPEDDVLMFRSGGGLSGTNAGSTPTCQQVGVLTALDPFLLNIVVVFVVNTLSSC